MADIIVQPKRFNGTDNDNLIMNTAKNLRDNSNNDIPLITDTNRNINVKGIVSDKILYKGSSAITTNATDINIGEVLTLNSFVYITILFYCNIGTTTVIDVCEKTEMLEILDLSSDLGGQVSPNTLCECNIGYYPLNVYVKAHYELNDNKINFYLIDNSSGSGVSNVNAILKTIRVVKE